MTESESSPLTRQTESRLSLATFITLAESAIMPCLVVGVGCAEPPPADLAVICSRGVAWFIHRRYRLAGANDVAGFCLILLLQHSPSSQAILRAFSDVVGGPGGRASTNLSDNFLQRACIKSRRNCSMLALLPCFHS